MRKGQKGTQIVFYKQLGTRSAGDRSPAEPVDSDKDERASFVLTYHTVFNVEQCENLEVPVIEPAAPRTEIEKHATCEAIVNGWEGRPALHLASETEHRAYYRPGTDTVHMPLRSRFVGAPHYYSTLFHELVHSTGHASRLARTFGKQFGDDLYSKEELIAETGAAFLCTIAGIGNDYTERNTAAYIQHWINRLSQDNRLIVTAAATAQRAVDSILGTTFESQAEADGAGTPADEEVA